jgi:hypothetical protein
MCGARWVCGSSGGRIPTGYQMARLNTHAEAAARLTMEKRTVDVCITLNKDGQVSYFDDPFALQRHSNARTTTRHLLKRISRQSWTIIA